MLNTGTYLSEQWYLIILVPLLLVASLYTILKNPQGRKMFDGFFLKVPIVSQIVKKNNSAFLIRSLSSLIASGVPLTRSLEISSKTINNYYFKEAIIEAEKRIRQGDRLSDALKSYQYIFPIGVIEMIEVGEETGKTAVIFKKLADFYEQEAIDSIEKLTVLIEPMLIIFLGVSVGFFALSIIQPIYSSLKLIST